MRAAETIYYDLDKDGDEKSDESVGKELEDQKDTIGSEDDLGQGGEQASTTAYRLLEDQVGFKSTSNAVGGDVRNPITIESGSEAECAVGGYVKRDIALDSESEAELVEETNSPPRKRRRLNVLADSDDE